MNKSFWWLAAYIIVGVLLGSGIIFLVTRPPRGEPIVLLPPPTHSLFMVYVSGAIENPGLFTVPAGSRVNDVIQAAGGTTDNANIGALNLAKFVEDGE
jgi:competence protein ComEA